jgi:Asp-tRNA(Asn)/Glu-tRNA(Gln) amidotransferase C subunit
MDIDELKVTAQLAHLTMTDEELRSVLPAFDEMLDNFALMQAADNDAAAFGAPLAEIDTERPPVHADWYRADAGNTDAPQVASDTMLDSSGERDGPFIVIPNVL